VYVVHLYSILILLLLVNVTKRFVTPILRAKNCSRSKEQKNNNTTTKRNISKMSQRTHSGGLYCSEGSTHVSRPSVRVRQAPGGDSGFNFFTGESNTTTTNHQQPPQQQQQPQQPKQQQLQERTVPKSPKNSKVNYPDIDIKPHGPTTTATPKQEQSQTTDSYQGRSSVRVRQPPGGATGWSFS
jgi:hypothetical protein